MSTLARISLVVFIVGAALFVLIGLSAILSSRSGLSEAQRVSIIEATTVGDSTRLSGLLAGETEIVNKITDEDGNSLLSLALHFGNYSTVRLLLDLGADPNSVDGAGTLPLRLAAGRGDYRSFVLLQKYGAIVGDPTALLAPAAHGGNVEIVRALLRSGAKVSTRDSNGTTPLHEAANSTIATLLMSHGAPIDAIDNSGNTPLHTAVINRRRDVIQVLILHGENISIRNNDGLTPVDLADRENFRW